MVKMHARRRHDAAGAARAGRCDGAGARVRRLVQGGGRVGGEARQGKMAGSGCEQREKHESPNTARAHKQKKTQTRRTYKHAKRGQALQTDTHI